MFTIDTAIFFLAKSTKNKFVLEFERCLTKYGDNFLNINPFFLLISLDLYNCYTIHPYIHEWIATFWYDWREKLKVDLNNFWVVHYIILYTYVMQKELPNTLLYIAEIQDTSMEMYRWGCCLMEKISNNSLKFYLLKRLYICSQ